MSTSNRRLRKPHFKDEEIDVAELAGMSNMKGMLSFLETKPEDYARLLGIPPDGKSSLPQGSRTKPVVSFPLDSRPSTRLPLKSKGGPDGRRGADPRLLDGYLENSNALPLQPADEREGSRGLPGESANIHRDRLRDQDVVYSKQPPGSKLLPGEMADAGGEIRLIAGSDVVAEEQAANSLNPGSDLPSSQTSSGGELDTAQYDGHARSLPGSSLIASDSVTQEQIALRKLQPGSELPLSQGVERGEGSQIDVAQQKVDSRSLPGSSLMTGGDLTAVDQQIPPSNLPPESNLPPGRAAGLGSDSDIDVAQPKADSSALPGSSLITGSDLTAVGQQIPPSNLLPDSTLPPGQAAAVGANGDIDVAQPKADSSALPGSSLITGSDLTAVGQQIPPSNLLPDSTLPPGQAAAVGANGDIDVAQPKADSSALPGSSLITGSDLVAKRQALLSNVQSDSDLPLNPKIGSDVGGEVDNCRLGSNLETDSDRLRGERHVMDGTQKPGSAESEDHPGRVLNTKTPHRRVGLQRIGSLGSESELPFALDPVTEKVIKTPDRLPGSRLLVDRSTDKTFSTLSKDPGSNLLVGDEIRTPNGRTVRLRLVKSVQDAHTNGEHLLLTAMWKKGVPESDDTRLLRVGLAEMSRWTGSHKTSCRAYVRALIAKLALEEAEPFDAAAGSEGARVYRIFSFNTILERRRRANLTHVIRTGAVSFVDPKTGERLIPSSNLPLDQKLRQETIVLPDSNLARQASSNQLLIKNREEPFKQSAIIHEALRSYGLVDDDVFDRLLKGCRQQAADCTEEEIVHFIHLKGSLVKGRDSRIHSPIGFLLTAVPKCFSGDTFRQYRQAEARRRDEEAVRELGRQAELDEWGREQRARLNDPTVPDDEKQLIRRWLGQR
jgi:hypothetical protein